MNAKQMQTLINDFVAQQTGAFSTHDVIEHLCERGASGAEAWAVVRGLVRRRLLLGGRTRDQ